MAMNKLPLVAATVAVILAATASAQYNITVSSENIVACPYSQLTWSLSEGTRHRMKFDFSSLGTNKITSCAFVFSCPSSSTGMAVKSTVGQGTSIARIPLLLYNDSEYSSTTYVSNSTDFNVVTPKRALAATVSVTGGYFHVMATCLTTKEVPSSASRVNYREGSRSYSSSTSYWADRPYLENTANYNYTNSFEVASWWRKAYTTTSTRRSYTASERKAYMISCYSKDLGNVINLAQIRNITGKIGSSGDKLTVVALDSGINKTYTGPNVTLNVAFARSMDPAEFQASSQYYVLWESDATAETAYDVDGPVIYYQCGESSTTFAATGTGESVQAATNAINGATAASLLMALAATAVFALLA